ncbi:Fibronectin-binding A domain protein [Syntrophobotulus glycolicus DSM 8271]|uniref:Rqc2 homolog RqcH n=1 Tax=Syntrophobotulus glycolicus (strain DSM 8271 / FlGlyR) TaxID=645991 RepID=F0T0I4_SYNGF|nr:NFACT RNA binding domain-containing protein [Syntrophobotulus glycolicus]ADY55049.1 Fibronectin-binding A domain protein [Syntrophobotulus glycolicus DSM 8271]
MALDSITLHHLINELRPLLTGSRIDKIHQPEKEEVHIIIRNNRPLKLLLNCSSNHARLHLTSENKKNPLSPPMFCMILRKHLEGGKILEINQQGLERVVKIIIQNYNDRGDLQSFELILEIMGKHSNLILLDSASQTILDGLKRYSHSVSRHREVLPGRIYIAPPSQNKHEPVRTEEKFKELILLQPLEQSLKTILVASFNGISPELAKEILLRAGLDDGAVLEHCGDIDLSRLYQAYSFFLIDTLNEAWASPEPCVYFQDQTKILAQAFTFIPYAQYSPYPLEKNPSLNEAVGLYHQKRQDFHTTEAMRGSLRKIVQDHLAHMVKKLNIYEDAIERAEKGLAYRKSGELITSNIYRIPAGAKQVELEDYTDPELKAVRIELDPRLTPTGNAQKYFKLYNKAKATILKTKPLQAEAQTEINYLSSLRVSLDQASSPDELKEIHNELIEQKYIAGKNLPARNKADKKHGTKKKQPEKLSLPHVYTSGSGHPIIVGRNNKQNDRMTWREARPHDLWLHVKQIPGSHVIVPLQEGEEFPDDTTLLEAAALAAYFSQARGSSHIPVDYTHVRQIKKPNGAKPGMVVYEQNWSLLITPRQDTIDALLATETGAELDSGIS